ncbi:UTRA domain-containing protein [Bacillus sp. es.034]|uniref:UTRA domain-containing protein n=1 Tax=Bacillus sp. es.034 TaxID=1761763 RepID=UPI00336AD749
MIKVGILTKDDSQLLNIPSGSRIVIAEGKITDSNGHFVEFENAYYRSDLYSFKNNLSRESH